MLNFTFLELTMWKVRHGWTAGPLDEQPDLQINGHDEKIRDCRHE